MKINYQKTGVTDIIRTYLTDYPSLPSRTIARKIVSEHPELTTIEKARTLIRQERNQNGVSKRRSGIYHFKNPEYQLPDESTYDSSPFEIKEDNILILPDLHIPFHDKIAIISTFNWAKGREVNAILINGDLIDSYQLSWFSRDPRERKYDEELQLVMEFLETLHETFKVPIYYKLGNHDDRLEYYIYNHAPELAGVKEMDIGKFLHLEEFNCQIIRDKRIIHMNRLNILHGHELGRNLFSPVNFARSLYLRTGDTTIAGHSHATSEHTGKRINGEIVTCWSTGCLCQLRPKYMSINTWNHGFAYIRNAKDVFRVENKRIYNGEVY